MSHIIDRARHSAAKHSCLLCILLYESNKLFAYANMHRCICNYKVINLTVQIKWKKSFAICTVECGVESGKSYSSNTILEFQIALTRHN